MKIKKFDMLFTLNAKGQLVILLRTEISPKSTPVWQMPRIKP